MWKNYISRLHYAVVLLLFLSGCSGAITIKIGTLAPTSVSNSSGSSGSSGSSQFGVQSKTSGCAINGEYPDKACTPGAVFPNVTASEVCISGYSSGVRDVSTAEKNMVYAEYGITSHLTGEYEVDHFVSLELGGSNDISNLWPEPAAPEPGFHEKDKVENYLHAQVCKGAMTLQEAQREIATDWYVVYQSMPK